MLEIAWNIIPFKSHGKATGPKVIGYARVCARGSRCDAFGALSSGEGRIPFGRGDDTVGSPHRAQIY